MTAKSVDSVRGRVRMKLQLKTRDELVAVATAGLLEAVPEWFGRYVWARLYTSKMPVTTVQILNNHALPFFEARAIEVQTILSDNGRE